MSLTRFKFSTAAFALSKDFHDDGIACLSPASINYRKAANRNTHTNGVLIAGFVNGRYEKKNRGLLKEFLMSPRVSMIEIDEETSERYAIIVNYLREQGTPIPTNDIWIAASAMQYGLKIITSDKHYLKVPLVLVEIPAQYLYPAKHE